MDQVCVTERLPCDDTVSDVSLHFELNPSISVEIGDFAITETALRREQQFPFLVTPFPGKETRSSQVNAPNPGIPI
jgi:hypothetical protein